MANNVFKVGTADDSLSIQQGSFAVGASGLGDYGPTSRTGYYAGIDVPEGGYVFYQPDGNGSFNINVAHDDTQAMFFLQSYGATGTTLSEMLTWASASGSVVGLSADITTTTILESIGSSGTSGSSGSGGGSSQFPTAHIVNVVDSTIHWDLYNDNATAEAACYGLSPSSVETVIYTSGPNLTTGTALYLEPTLTEKLATGNGYISDGTKVWKFETFNGVTYTRNEEYSCSYEKNPTQVLQVSPNNSQSDICSNANTNTIPGFLEYIGKLEGGTKLYIKLDGVRTLYDGTTTGNYVKVYNSGGPEWYLLGESGHIGTITGVGSCY